MSNLLCKKTTDLLHEIIQAGNKQSLIAPKSFIVQEKHRGIKNQNFQSPIHVNSLRITTGRKKMECITGYIKQWKFSLNQSHGDRKKEKEDAK